MGYNVGACKGSDPQRGQAEHFCQEKLFEMELPPPHVPELRSATDMSHFDDPTVEPGFLNEPEYDYSVSTQWDMCVPAPTVGSFARSAHASTPACICPQRFLMGVYWLLCTHLLHAMRGA